MKHCVVAIIVASFTMLASQMMFNRVAALLLLMCVTTAALLVRSYRVADVLEWAPATTYYYNCDAPQVDSDVSATSSRGELLFTIETFQPDSSSEQSTSRVLNHTRWAAGPIALQGGWQFLGWGYSCTSQSVFSTLWEMKLREIIVPDWFIASLLAVVPSIWIIKARKRFWDQSLGLCGNCGYDLRATPDRCPECGEVPQKLVNK